MSSVTSVDTKSIVDSYMSSTNSDTISTAVEYIKNKQPILNKVLDILKHPKIKWVLIGLVLCAVSFFYLNTQKSKISKLNKKQIENTNVNTELNENNRPILVDKKEYIEKLANLELKEKQLLEKINKMNNPASQMYQNVYKPHVHQHQQSIPQQPKPQQSIPQQPQPQPSIPLPPKKIPDQPTIYEEDDNSSEEVFIENENVRNHNLTMDEMNVINKQLENINMEYESD